MKVRKASLLLLLLLLIPIISYAGGKQEATGPKTLRVVEYFLADIGNTAQYNMVKTQYNMFEAKYGCKLDISSFSWSDAHQQLQIMAEAGALPDTAIYWFMNAGPLFVAKGYLESLEPYIKREGADFEKKYNPSVLLKINKTTYGIPYAHADMALYVNNDLLAENGIAGPPKTWQDLRTTSIKVNNPSQGVFGLAMDGGDEESLLSIAPFIAQNGGHVGKYNGKMNINSAATVEAIQFVVDLATKDKVIPAYISNGFKQAREIFNAGKSAYLVDASWNLKQIMPKETEFKWDVSLLPRGKQPGTSVPMGDGAWTIFSTSKNKDLAWELIKWMTSGPAAKQIVAARGSFPTASKELDQVQLADPKAGKYYETFLEQLKLGNALDVYGEMPAKLQGALDVWKEEFHASVLGDKTVRQAMDTVASKWDKMNQEWNAEYGKFTKDSAEQIW